MEGFIQGGVGDVRLIDVLDPQLRGFSTLKQRQDFADKYEREHPGAVVRRDWETPAEHEARKAKRQIANVPQPTQGMDPERAAKELRRMYQYIAGLTPDHPEYDRLFDNAAREIGHLEENVGIPADKRTQFTKGKIAEKKTDEVSAETLGKYEKWQKLSRAKQIASIEQTEDQAFLGHIHHTVTDVEIRGAAFERLAGLGALL